MSQRSSLHSLAQDLIGAISSRQTCGTKQRSVVRERLALKALTAHRGRSSVWRAKQSMTVHHERPRARGDPFRTLRQPNRNRNRDDPDDDCDD